MFFITEILTFPNTYSLLWVFCYNFHISISTSAKKKQRSHNKLPHTVIILKSRNMFHYSAAKRVTEIKLSRQNVTVVFFRQKIYCACLEDKRLFNLAEGPMSHDQPTYASVPGIRVYGMMCVRPTSYTGEFTGQRYLLFRNVHIACINTRYFMKTAAVIYGRISE